MGNHQWRKGRGLCGLCHWHSYFGYQVNIMPPGRKKRSVIGSTAVMILAAIKSAMETAQRAIPNLDVPKMDMRNASYVQMIVMEKMIRDPRSKIMAGCSDMKNCQQRLSLFI